VITVTTADVTQQQRTTYTIISLH